LLKALQFTTLRHLDSWSNSTTFTTTHSGSNPITIQSNLGMNFFQKGLLLFCALFAFAGASMAQIVTLDQWNANTSCNICGDAFTSTINSSYDIDDDSIDFTDPIGDDSECITAITLTFNVAAADLQLHTNWGDVNQIDQDFPIELNGYLIGYFDPTELPYICNVC
jgi:hypothetical protein